jgi:hypothetical protein
LMKQTHGNSISFLPEPLKLYASDCFVLLGQYTDALEFFPLPSIGSRSSMATDSLLSLKLVTGNKIAGRDVLTLCGPKVTEFGIKHLESVLAQADILLESLWNTARIDLIAEWAKDSHQCPYQVGIGSRYVYHLTKKVALQAYFFSNNQRATEFAANVTREAENRVRQQLGIANVGEGWIAETQLYYEVKNAFPDREVQQHASPEWLGRQHLDIFIPEECVAIEYQGAQHDQPVAYFGGYEAFEKNQKRDERKRRLCKKHGIRLIYVRPGYALQNVIEEIKSSRSMEMRA